MNKVISVTEAIQTLKRELIPGKYEITYHAEGGIYSPYHYKFDMKEIYQKSTIFWVVENYYLQHGNGD